MSALGLRIIDKSVQDANIWIDELMQELGWTDKQRSYRLMRAGLHALRDSLQPSEAAHLSAQLPIFIRGVFYEGWDPDNGAMRHKHEESFIAEIEKDFSQDPNIDPEILTRAFLKIVASRISPGEIEHIKSGMTRGVRSLWPDECARTSELT